MSKPLEPGAVYEEMRTHCLNKEGAYEERPWGDIAWKVKKKAFAFAGEGGSSFTLKSTPDRQAALTLHPNIKVAAYVGRFGWITIRVPDTETLALAKDLADESYELVGSRKNRKSRERA